MALMDTIQLSRRRLLATACAAGLGAVVTACTGRSPADDPSAA
ncbi:twin-arginine translocation signal domain-containing protein, partial [Nocardia brasiliensis]